MIRVLKTSFHASSEDLDRLFTCNRISAHVWNDCLHFAKSHFLEHGEWIDKTQLQKATKGKYPIHSQSIQAVCHKYLHARDNAHKAKQKGHSHIRYPYKTKKHFPTKWAAQGFTVHDNGRIELSPGIYQCKRQKPIVVWVKRVPNGVIKEIELIYDRGLQLAISYDDGIQPAMAKGTRIAAVDPGEIHSVACVTEDGEALIVTGRKLRSVKRLRNKKMKELRRKMAKCTRGSRQWRKYRRALHYVLSKSERQLQQEVVVGDVEGVQRNRSNKKRRRIGKRVRSRKHNQRMSQWQFGKQYEYMKYKLHAHGIAIAKQDERNTTQTCPVCTCKRKPSGRIYRCSCGYIQHRDIHGGCNILSVYKYGEIKPMMTQIQRIKYLRIA
ncbi:RNA-guided endonuclease InsQ/TnpB family protein [Paenibacillus alkalitolerans]|uniref:RNA-guided endonuclease InsQ/TnpB family protein n=1 Tax=Paenibacillus alkalitolerans TaxID=2799335 RepID=UPI0018F333B9|nr:RNA-guided endonuclease TnpB family protein [Paenibacillus alkalitolerans]